MKQETKVQRWNNFVATDGQKMKLCSNKNAKKVYFSKKTGILVAL